MVSRKKIALIVSCLLCAVLLCVSSFAAVLGDVDNDAKLTAADARLVLRQAVGLEHFNDTQKTAADVDFDKKITASDARLVLRAAVGLETLQQMNNDRGDVTVTVNGIAVTKVPYTKNGLTIESVSLDGNKLSCVFKNDTSETVSSSSNVEYKLYNAAGTVIESSYVTSKDMKAGDKSTNYLYISDDTAKVIFGDAKVSKGIDFANLPTENHSGIQITKLPYTYNGITVESLTVDTKYERVYCVAKNVSGSAVKNTTECAYRCYDASGKVLKTSSFYLEDLNNGEKCKPSFAYPTGTVKIQFGEVDVRKDEHHTDNATSSFSGLKCFQNPYTSKGLTLKLTGMDDRKISYQITNNTGKTLSSAYFNIKCYDAEGYVLTTTSFYAYRLNNGDTFSGYTYIKEGTTKLVAKSIGVNESTENYLVTSVSDVSGYKVTSLPYTAAGINVSSVSVDGRKMTFVCENKTGAPIEGGTVYFRLFDAAGHVLDFSSVSLGLLNNGEKRKESISVTSDTVKVMIANVSTVKGDQYAIPTATSTVNGLKTNKFPYTANGLRVNSCTYDSAKGQVTFNITNTTGSAVTDYSYITLKEYDASGNVVGSTEGKYTEKMNAGESCNVSYYLDEDTAAIYVVGAKSAVKK